MSQPTSPPETTWDGFKIILQGAMAAGPYLLVLDGPQAGRHIPLSPSLTLGRGRQAAVRFSDPELSRLHARILTAAGAIGVEDLGSKNGVRVNGERMAARRSQLRPGDQLAMGSMTLALIAPAEWNPAEPPGEPSPVKGPSALALASAMALVSAAIGLALAVRGIFYP